METFLDVNFEEASNTTDFGPVKPGEYEVVAVKYDLTPAGTGTPRTNFQFQIRGDVTQPYQNRILFHDFYHTPKTKGILIGFMKNLDEESDGIQFQSQEDFAKFVISKPIRAVVKVEEYQKNDGTVSHRNKISFFKKSENPLMAPAGELADAGIEPVLDDFPF